MQPEENDNTAEFFPMWTGNSILQKYMGRNRTGEFLQYHKQARDVSKVLQA